MRDRDHRYGIATTTLSPGRATGLEAELPPSCSPCSRRPDRFHVTEAPKKSMPMTAPLSDTSTRATVTDTGEACPYCCTSDRIRRTSDIGHVRAWVCEHCDTSWAYTVPDYRTAALGDLGAVAQEIRRLRWALAQGDHAGRRDAEH
jgi:hypothetical protein